MALKSITQKVIQVEKRQLEDNSKTAISTFAVFAFWAMATTLALVVAVISHYTADPNVGNIQFSQGIDSVTTAGIAKPARSGNSIRTRKIVAEAAAQKRRIESMANVITRLRNEQASFNGRLAELETRLRQAQTKTRKLEASLLLSKLNPTPKKAIILPDEKGAANTIERRLNKQENNASSRQLIPRTVGTHSITPNTKNTSLPVLNKTTPPKSGTSSFAKTNGALPSNNVDRTIVNSINRAQASKFGIDLGVSSTSGRASGLWFSLAHERSELLGNLTPKYIKTGKAEGETRLIAGPYNDASDAISACVKLRTSDTFCKTTLFPN